MRVFIVVDGEFSGPDLKKNYIVGIGACAMNEDGIVLDRFLVGLKPPPNRGMDPQCWGDFWSKYTDTLQKLEAMAVEPDKGMNMFCNWIDSIYEQYPKSVKLVGDAITSDYTWLNYYLMKYMKRLPLNFDSSGKYVGCPISAVDISRGVSKTLSNNPDKYLDVELKTNSSHMPDEDSICIATNFIAVLRKYEFIGTQINSVSSP